MTVSSTATRIAYTGNASTTAFPFSFRFLATTDIAVYVDGVLQSTGYTVSSPGASGTVTFSTAPASGVSVVITRATAKTQETDYVANDAFSADSTELAFDRAMLVSQDNAAAIGRALRVADHLPAINPITDPDDVVLSWAQLPVNVQTFGAKGDGVTDDKAAIQAAFDYAASLPDGAEVFFPTGVYRLSGAINITNAKSLTVTGCGDSSVVQMITGTGGPIFNCGHPSLVYSTRLIIQNIFFRGPVSGTSKGITLQNCNTAKIKDCVFQSQATGIETVESYAVEILGNVFDVCSLYGFIAATKCHNAVLERNNFYTCLQGARFDVTSDAITIDNNNFEYCGSPIYLTNCNAVSIRGNYIEYQTNAVFDLVGTSRQVFIENNFIALGSGGGAVATLNNITGGTFKGNFIYNQTVSTGAALVDFVIGDNYKTGTGTMPVQPWIAPTLLNSWANQANYAPAGYRKDDSGVVYLRGNLTGGAALTTAFNLPVGYRPATFITFACMGGGGAVWIEVRPNGDVLTVTAPGNLTALNGISFNPAA